MNQNISASFEYWTSKFRVPDLLHRSSMKNVVRVAALAAVVGLALFVRAYTSSAPADFMGRKDYATALQHDFVDKRVTNTAVWVSGPDNRQLNLDAPWLDNSTARALISGGIARKARRAGFDLVVFENRGLKLVYEVPKRAFNGSTFDEHQPARRR
jgi:hypothetical protein